MIRKRIGCCGLIRARVRRQGGWPYMYTLHTINRRFKALRDRSY